MRYRSLLAHVYSSGEAYATSRPAVNLTGLRPDSHLGPLTIEVGTRPPRWVFRARRRLYALNLLAGGNLAGWLAGTHSAHRFRLRRGELSRPWYTTLLLHLPPLEVDVQEWDAALEHESVLREAALLLASQFSARVIERLDVRGLFLQGQTGDWVKTPEFAVFPPSVYVGQGEATLRQDLANAERTLRTLAIGATRGPSWVEWAHRALLTDEPWSRFVWMMFSLEQMTEAYDAWMPAARRLASRATGLSSLRAARANPTLKWNRTDSAMRFAVIAADLSPMSAAADTAVFDRLRTLRNDLLHGARLDPPDGSALQDASALALRYSGLVGTSPLRP